jgi:uncharacterized membrane protein
MVQPADEIPAETAADSPPAGTGPDITAELEARGADRVVLFSDAVVAIAITLLALDLPVPSGHDAAAFLASVAMFGPEYLSFLISFCVIGRHWMNHHGLFRDVVRVQHRLIALNLGWLLMIVITPFMTRVLAEDDISQTSFGLYAITQAVLCVVFTLMAWTIIRNPLLRADPTDGAARRSATISLLWVAAFVVSIPLFALMHAWAFLCWWLIPVVGERLLARVDRRRG